MKNGDSLEYAVDQLINERKITNVHSDYLNEKKFKNRHHQNFYLPGSLEEIHFQHIQQEADLHL